MNRLLGSALIVIGVGLLLLGFLGWLNFTLVFNLVVRGIAPPRCRAVRWSSSPHTFFWLSCRSLPAWCLAWPRPVLASA